MDGIINICKEKGYTSFDVVAILRGILHEKKIGHCGTLDPDAEGVLVVCTGHATKLVDLLTAHEKTYEAVLRLGITTDTQDIGGEILRKCDVSVGEEDIIAVAQSFTGEIEQLPPMYSAVKVNGKKLCDYARAGKKAERKPRKVYIREIVIDRIELPDVYMTVSCSKGTYIRTLCDDIGNRLGCGGTMASLKRIRSGAFSIEDARTLDQIREEMRRVETLEENESFPAFLRPLDSCFYYLPSVSVKGEKDFLVKNGNPVRLSESWFQEPLDKNVLFDYDDQLQTGKNDIQNNGSEQKIESKKKKMVRVYLEDGTFAGVYEYREDRKYWKPWKMFITAEQK